MEYKTIPYEYRNFNRNVEQADISGTLGIRSIREMVYNDHTTVHLTFGVDGIVINAGVPGISKKISRFLSKDMVFLNGHLIVTPIKASIYHYNETLDIICHYAIKDDIVDEDNPPDPIHGERMSIALETGFIERMTEYEAK